MKSSKHEIIALIIWAVTALMTLLAYQYLEVPEVHFSVATGQPIAVERYGQVTKVSPDTPLPERFEKVWVP